MNRLVFAAAVLITTISTFAGPLKPKSLPANTTWFVHLDADAISSSTFGKCLLSGVEKAGAWQFQEMQTKLGIDPYKDIYSLTVFGLGAAPAKGIDVKITGDNLEVGAIVDPTESIVALAEINADAAKSLIEHLSEVTEAYRQISLGDYKVHAMIAPTGESDENGEGETKLLVYIKPGADASRKTLVISDKKQLLLTAIKALNGDAPNLTSRRDSVLSLKHRAGSLLVMSANDIHELTGGNGGSEILKGTKSFSLEISEVDEIVNINASMATKSPEIAKNIMDVVQGALAFARMSMQQENPDEDMAAILKLAQGLNFSSDNERISVNLEHPSKALCELLESRMSALSYDEDEDEVDY